jgi:SPP1 family predicted phage head-tail adaptor
MGIRAGKLRHEIEIQQPSETQDAYGEPTGSWSTFAAVRASVEPLQGREFFASQQMQAEVTTRFRIRWISGVSPSMRILFGTRLFNISAVINPDEKNHELHIMAVEVITT